MKFIISLLIRITWFSNLGEKLKYRLKHKSFTFKKTGWSIQLYEYKNDVLNKKWKLKNIFGWFSRNFTELKNVVGIADPFLINYNSDIYVFFEVETVESKKNIGQIWTSRINNNKFEKPFKVLSENYHLSFPNVFNYDGSFYMIPESHQNKTVSLYRSDNFPENWQLVKDLKSNVEFVDTNFVELKGVFYWFTYDLNINMTRLFFSDSLFEEWVEHNSSPINLNRNAGAIFNDESGTLIRPVQISNNSYGEGVELLKISTLSKEDYKEEIVNPKFLYKSKGYNLDGVHHFSFLENEKIVITDGLNNNFYKLIK